MGRVSQLAIAGRLRSSLNVATVSSAVSARFNLLTFVLKIAHSTASSAAYNIAKDP
jgi:hypothetical protein